MRWGQIPGEHSLVACAANGKRYRVHVGHGRVWYALEFNKEMTKALAGEIFDGPEASRHAREWCDQRASAAAVRVEPEPQR